MIEDDKTKNDHFRDMIDKGDFRDMIDKGEERGFNPEFVLFDQYFTNWIRKSSSFIPISKYFSVKCLKS